MIKKFKHINNLLKLLKNIIILYFKRKKHINKIK